jgi:hypothetical protein
MIDVAEADQFNSRSGLYTQYNIDTDYSVWPEGPTLWHTVHAKERLGKGLKALRA